ncbi:MAG: hypothetical protein ABSH29_15365 [Acidimicrobiales bacterium]
MTVRQRIDQMAAEPPGRDLGYAADQRLVAGALLGLQLLADEIDALKAGRVGAVDTGVEYGRDDRDIAEDVDIADIVDQLAELTAQVKKLTKAVKRGTGNRGTGKPGKKQVKKSKKSDDSPERG